MFQMNTLLRATTRAALRTMLLVLCILPLGVAATVVLSAPEKAPVLNNLPQAAPLAPNSLNNASAANGNGSSSDLVVSSAGLCGAGLRCSFVPVVFHSGVSVSIEPPAVTAVDPRSRAGAVEMYRKGYVASNNTSAGWTGSVGSCSAGTTSKAFRAAVLARINYFRQMAGLPALTGLTAASNKVEQAAALMMSANNQLSHSPSSSWKCYTSAGKNAAGGSNLYLGSFGPAAISGYMRDPGAGNTALGHRRWILYPQTQQMGSGDIPANGKYPAANALSVWDDHFGDARPATRNAFVAWPPAAYVPYQVVFARWSFAYPGADFNSATVKVTRGGKSIAVKRYAPVNGFGENTLVWDVNNMADGANWARPSSDQVYTVTVSNVKVNGKVKNFTYKVTVIDPEK